MEKRIALNTLLIFILSWILLLISSCSKNEILIKEKNTLLLDNSYPKWLVNSYQTDQTSGIAFLKLVNGIKYFILVDDIGAIHLLKIKNDNIDLQRIEVSAKVEDFLKKFNKKDFEEIAYDKKTNKYYLSIEGNGSNYKDEVGIYELKFEFENELPQKLIDIKKLEFPSWSEITKYTRANIGFEGVGISDNYLFLGLEGFEKDGLFLDSTYIYVFDKVNLKFKKIISTKELNIHTICGLYSENDYTLWGIDRNNSKIFKIHFDKNFNIDDLSIFIIKKHIPDYPDYQYTTALESITMDDDRNIYLVDDPWKKFYVPEKEIYNLLDQKTQENFKNYIPIIYKYKNIEED